MRINKFLASCGICSRRGADRLIERGKIKVNGKVVREKGYIVDPENDNIFLYGKKVVKEEKVYIIMNKPVGFVTTVSDPQGRKTVMDLLPDLGTRLYPVGRLDYNSSGLLLLTNDGDLSFRLLHPKYKVYKTYRVHLRGAYSPVKIKKLREGVQLKDGITAPCEVRIIRSAGKDTVLEIKIYEGRKRQIRRMCNEVGYEVIGLTRIQMGNLKLTSLKPGAHRFLGPNEINKLKTIAGLI